MTFLTQEYLPYITPIFERKPKAVTAINVKDMTSYTDMVVIVEAGSNRQVTSLAEHLIKTLKGQNIKAMGVEGVKQGEWALLDFGHIIIHFFESQAKGFYDIEGLWSDAPRVDLAEFAKNIPDPEDDDEF
ncbi:MAG: ribosome silencing factor [Desulfobacter sp.]|nr:ribosome silencing factor [Desulfobacter sp.]WDP86983.1 MAG: ribosome silencing factor [Desulfobacter sp.]